MVPVALPMWTGVAALILGLLSRRMLLALTMGFLASSMFSFNAIAGLAPVTSQAWSGTITLVNDPQAFPGRVVVIGDTDLGRVQVTAASSAARELRQASAWSEFTVTGSLRPLANQERLLSRHVRMSLVATKVEPRDGGTLWRIPVETVRQLIRNGSEALPLEQRPVYNGFVIGDDRGSETAVVESFKEAGLTHLLVVSGENLVFVIAVATPLLVRLPRRTRVGVTIVILVLFAAVTRFEPSILRATAMALIALIGVGSGRPIDSRQRLAAAVSVLVLIDPLLVESLGFQLSIAATAGITCFSRAIMRAVRGPVWFRQVFSVTVAAQIAVAPLIVPTFGPLPLASLPANVLAGPIAGFVMMWGSSVGLLAGLVGNGPATILLLPVRAGLWWILNVASWCAALPLPRLNLVAITGLFGIGLLIFQWRYGGRTRSLEHRQRPPAG